MFRGWFVFAVAVLLLPACKSGSEKAGEKSPPTEQPTQEPKPAAAEKAAPPAPESPLVARGRYLAGLAGCAQCHTPFGPGGPDLARAYAGGLEVPEEFGTWRSPNITPDRKTGIGDWTDEEIVAAVREGKRPDGSQLFPIMPYLFYNVLSDADSRALVAFLRSLKPVEHAVAGNTDLKQPKIPAPKPSGAPPVAGDEVAQGKYLASLMHCAACHTPMTHEGPDMSKAFAGGFKFEAPPELEPVMGKGVLYSPNITTDRRTGIGAWTKEEVIASFTKFIRPDGGPLGGPMRMYEATWPAITPADASAVAAFVMSLPPIEHKVPQSSYEPPPPPGAAGKGAP